MTFKLLVLYPPPANAAEFERAYTEDHAPMVTSEAFPGITKFVQVKVVGTPDGSSPQYARIAELHFDSISDLQKAAGGEGASATVAHANEISTGGAPLILVCEETKTGF
ncbi:MAG: EthD family reductase [Acidobacteriota bacterium]